LRLNRSDSKKDNCCCQTGDHGFAVETCFFHKDLTGTGLTGFLIWSLPTRAWTKLLLDYRCFDAAIRIRFVNGCL
jgi:hypothetical protein